MIATVVDVNFAIQKYMNLAMLAILFPPVDDDQSLPEETTVSAQEPSLQQGDVLVACHNDVSWVRYPNGFEEFESDMTHSTMPPLNGGIFTFYPLE